MTIHRAQGLTLDAARIDIRAAREPGQAYVALSRVRTLGRIYLTEWPKGWFISEEALRFERREEV
jgi:ATP-dependent exoDNAse (exonuclease V) alpha subunit